MGGSFRPISDTAREGRVEALPGLARVLAAYKAAIAHSGGVRPVVIDGGESIDMGSIQELPGVVLDGSDSV